MENTRTDTINMINSQASGGLGGGFVYFYTKHMTGLIDSLIILFQLSNILSTNTIFDGRPIYTPFKNISTYNTFKINKNIKSYKKTL